MEYTSKKKESVPGKQSETGKASKTAGNIPNSALESVMAGRMKATSEMMGHRQDLAPSLNAKMSKAFGMDLNGVQVYRSDVMSGTGTEGLASGNKIVLSSDVDLNTLSGQAVLGHELSHIHAQSQGIGLGNTGLYENAGLEHQADTEGMMAARGLSLNGETLGMDTASGMQGFANATPMSSGMGLTAGAPMQAKKEKTEEDRPTSKGKKFAGGLLGGIGRAFQGLGAGLNLLTGGHLFGSLYNKLQWDGGAGHAIGKALLAPLSFVTNLPSTIIGGMGHVMASGGSKLWNSGWASKSEGKAASSEANPNSIVPEMIFNENNTDDIYEKGGFAHAFNVAMSGGTRFANKFINPGNSPKKSWIEEIAKRNKNRRRYEAAEQDKDMADNLVSQYDEEDADLKEEETADNPYTAPENEYSGPKYDKEPYQKHHWTAAEYEDYLKQKKK